MKIQFKCYKNKPSALSSCHTIQMSSTDKHNCNFSQSSGIFQGHPSHKLLDLSIIFSGISFGVLQQLITKQIQMTTKLVSDIVFNNSVIPYSQIFLMRKNVFGLINNRPFVKGHVLVCSRRAVQKIQNLTQIQTLDLFMTAQQVAKKLQTIYNIQYDLTVQNGKDAGQTVFHVHIHLCPKHEGGTIQRKVQEARTQEDMAKQAQRYRGLFEQSSE